MDKSRVQSVLAAYSPPLSPNQIDTIAEEISRISEAEIVEAVKQTRARVKSRKS